MPYPQFGTISGVDKRDPTDLQSTSDSPAAVSSPPASVKDGLVRVCHIITRLDRGGSSDNTLFTVLGLQEKGFESCILKGPGIPGEGPSPLEQIARERGIKIVLLPHLVRSIRLSADLRAIGEIYRFLKTGEFDIVHTHSSKAGILGRLAARWAKVSVIVHTPHGHIFYGYFGPTVSWIYLQLERWAARFTDRIITLTQRGREEHLSRGVGRPEQYVTIPSGIPLDEFFPDPVRRQRVRDALEIPLEAQVVGTVGRLTAVKDQKTLIRAVERLKGEHPGLIVLLIGDGELRGALEEQVRRLHLQEVVRFLGWRPDVPDLLNALDLFVLCSLNEGMGRALVEAMATGLPAVATSVGGIPDLIEEGVNGCLVPTGDADRLASAISRTLNDPDRLRALGEKSREISAEYTVDNMVRQLGEFYREIFQKKAA